MYSATKPNDKLAAKPLGLLGRDEMNLAEFPITLITDRVPKGQKAATYQDEIYDDRTGRTLARKLTIQAGNYGLTTAVTIAAIAERGIIQVIEQENGGAYPPCEAELKGGRPIGSTGAGKTS